MHPVETLLSPLLDPAHEKASLLAQELQATIGARRGLRRTIRSLEQQHGPAAVEAAARRLVERIRQEREQREPLR